MAFSPTRPLAAVSARAFVISSPDDGGAGYTTFLCAEARADASDLPALWNGASGILLFSNTAVDGTTADLVADALASRMAAPMASPTTWRIVAWTDDPADAVDLDGLLASDSGAGVFTLSRAWKSSWGALDLTLDQELTVRLDGASLLIEAAAADVGRVGIALGGATQQLGYSRDGFRIPVRLAGPGTGSLRIPVGLDPSGLLTTFRGGFLHALPDDAGTVFFPMVPRLSRTIDQWRAFDLWLNPIRKLDASCTRFSADLSGRLTNPGFGDPAGDALAAPYFNGPDGGAVSLTPFDPGDIDPAAMAGGFAFSQGPDGLYLSPCGLWSAGAAAALMPGLSGEEFLTLGAGDLVEFVANQPPDGPSTTSWMRVVPGGAAPPGYDSQPSASSFFGGQKTFPVALNVRVGSFTAPSAPFPAVPYGGVYLPVPSDPDTRYPPPFAGAPASLAKLEATFLAGTRHELLTVSSLGPVFMPEGTDRPDPALDRATTPQGLLLELAVPGATPKPADGTIARLVLAMTPALPSIGVAAEYLSFEAGDNHVVPPRLGNLLTRDQLFLVISQLPDEVPDACFRRILDLAGFELDVDVGASGGAILVFKFNDQLPLSELAGRTELWADTKGFCGDVGATLARLAASIAAASGSANARAFATFQAIMDDPGWTGMLAFDVLVNGDAMPADLQALLGGIQGELRAHHLGVEANKLSPTAAHTLELVESSLFGVINYDEPPSLKLAAPDYEVEHLLVVFSNSRVTQSEATIGVSFDTLFGRKVWLTQPAGPDADPRPNTLRIVGQSQVVDGVDTITFVTGSPFDFAFSPAPTGPMRVLRLARVTHASLVPVSSTPIAGGTGKTVLLRLLMSGELFFAADPFHTGIDLFSYGTPERGAAFTGLSVEVTFDLDGGVVSNKKTTLLENLVTATPDPAVVRGGSFLAAMPAQFTRLITTADALTSVASGASPVHIVELETQPPRTTASPVWALEYDVHLGSLGAMADDHAGIAAKLLLGWGPSAVAPDDDAACMLVQLPHLGGGVAGFSLEGLLTTRFGDGNLIRADLGVPGAPDWVYAILFNHVQVAFLGYDFPPGLLVDFAVFAGAPDGSDRKTNNIAWFIGAIPA